MLTTKSSILDADVELKQPFLVIVFGYQHSTF